MTKKDFELIASILRDDNYLWRALHGGEMGIEYREKIAQAFSQTLASKNPRFNKEKFLKACGVEIEQKCACDGCNNVAEQYYKKEKYCDGHYCMIHSTM